MADETYVPIQFSLFFLACFDFAKQKSMPFAPLPITASFANQRSFSAFPPAPSFASTLQHHYHSVQHSAQPESAVQR